MLKVKLTENYGGVTIYGDFDDLDYLYEAIIYLIRDEAKDIHEYAMQEHLYAFLYEVRHTYQGQRDVELVDNGVSENQRKWLNLKKQDVTDNNLYLCFNYLLPDLILDMILVKHFIKKIDKKNNDEYNSYINMVNYFYSIALSSLEKELTKIKFNKIKKGIKEAIINPNKFIPQWFEIISINYANMTKKQREKELIPVMEAIYNFEKHEKYFDFKKDIEKICKEKNCNINNLYYENYPEEIEW